MCWILDLSIGLDLGPIGLDFGHVGFNLRLITWDPFILTCVLLVLT